MSKKNYDAITNEDVDNLFEFILDTFIKKAVAPTVNEMANEMNRPVSSILPMLQALVYVGKMRHLGRHKGYTINPDHLSIKYIGPENEA